VVSTIGLPRAECEAAPPSSDTDGIERKSEATLWTGQRQCGADEDGDAGKREIDDEFFLERST
jgi:hypothetical protein